MDSKLIGLSSVFGLGWKETIVLQPLKATFYFQMLMREQLPLISGDRNKPPLITT